MIVPSILKDALKVTSESIEKALDQVTAGSLSLHWYNIYVYTMKPDIIGTP